MPAEAGTSSSFVDTVVPPPGFTPVPAMVAGIAAAVRPAAS
ncbi:hypothetical protein ARZXY2_2606 [Arthrobacter sp. ZXY-2]|nr:hypothetical protein ARZXY2_2606 [Arthrobacter sp. ZXY-2]